MVNEDNFWDKDRSKYHAYEDKKGNFNDFSEEPIIKKTEPADDMPSSAADMQEADKPLNQQEELGLMEDVFNQEEEEALYAQELEAEEYALQEQALRNEELETTHGDLQGFMTDNDVPEQFADKTVKNQGFGPRRPRGLSPARKLCFSMLVLFIVAWCFYVGFSYGSEVSADNWQGYSITKENLEVGDLKDLGQSGIMTILMVGCDKREDDSGRTDTIMLAFLDLDHDNAKILSIPRDTYVSIPTTGGKTKINHAYAYGGIPLTESTIEKFLGIKIDHYIEIDFAGFADVVDALGGITIDVEMRMYTPWEGIDLQPGSQLLDGQDALAYVRYREKTEGDIGRVDRQQKFIGVLADEMFSSSNVLKLPKVIDVAMENVETDLRATQALSLANFFRKIGVSNIELFKLPGTADMIGGVSYWIVDDNTLSEVVDYVTDADDAAGNDTQTQSQT
jgi:LCP family protein required for cell wall assembly